MIFKVEAYGDAIYIDAANKEFAAQRLREVCGDIPESLLTWSTIAELPEGEGLL